MKLLNKFRGLMALTVIILPCTAKSSTGWVDYIHSIEPMVIASLGSTSNTAQYAHSNLAAITRRVYPVLSQLEYDISSRIETELRSEVGRYNNIPGIHYSLRSFNFDLVDPFEIKLVDLGSGNVQAQVRFNVSLYARIRNTSNPLPSNVTLNYDTSEILFKGDYNLATGLLDNFLLENIEGRSRSSASNALSIISNVVAQVIPSIINDAVENAKDEINSLVGDQSISLFGLDEVIPSEKLIVGSLDVGKNIKDFLYGSIDNEFLLLKIKRKTIHYSSGDFYRGIVMNVNLSDVFYLEFKDHIELEKVWVPCDLVTGICYEIP